MRLIRNVPLALSLTPILLSGTIAQAESPTFRGPERDGIFPADGLAQEWPADGPKLLWSAKGLGEGFSSMAVADGRIYTTGMKDGQGSVFALDLNGKTLWKTGYGPVHEGAGFPGSRSTPTTDGTSVFIHSSMGKAMAFDAETGKRKWSVDLLKTYGGENVHFGISESPLLDGDKVIFSAGGKDAALVALNQADGKLIWRTRGLSEPSAYCAPVIMEHGKHRQILTLVGTKMVGVDPESGEVLWQHPFEATYGIHSTSPVTEGNIIYVSHGYDQGGKAFRLAADGRSVKEIWSEPKLDIHHGGAVVVDGVVYGAASKKSWYALDMETGKVLGSIRRLGKGSVVFADGRLYGYVESGKLLLVNPDPNSFKVISETKIEAGEGHHWSHPVIVDGVLYVRHGDVLMAFDVRPSKAAKA